MQLANKHTQQISYPLGPIETAMETHVAVKSFVVLEHAATFGTLDRLGGPAYIISKQAHEAIGHVHMYLYMLHICISTCKIHIYDIGVREEYAAVQIAPNKAHPQQTIIVIRLYRL